MGNDLQKNKPNNLRIIDLAQYSIDISMFDALDAVVEEIILYGGSWPKIAPPLWCYGSLLRALLGL